MGERTGLYAINCYEFPAYEAADGIVSACGFAVFFPLFLCQITFIQMLKRE